MEIIFISTVQQYNNKLFIINYLDDILHPFPEMGSLFYYYFNFGRLLVVSLIFAAFKNHQFASRGKWLTIVPSKNPGNSITGAFQKML